MRANWRHRTGPRRDDMMELRLPAGEDAGSHMWAMVMMVDGIKVGHVGLVAGCETVVVMHERIGAWGELGNLPAGIEIRAGTVPCVGPEDGACGKCGCEAQDDGLGFVFVWHFGTPCFACCFFPFPLAIAIML